jgi:hypothetical protein
MMKNAKNLPVREHRRPVLISNVNPARWTHIDGFSEGVLRFIHEIEHAQ